MGQSMDGKLARVTVRDTIYRPVSWTNRRSDTFFSTGNPVTPWAPWLDCYKVARCTLLDAEPELIPTYPSATIMGSTLGGEAPPPKAVHSLFVHTEASLASRAAGHRVVPIPVAVFVNIVEMVGLGCTPTLKVTKQALASNKFRRVIFCPDMPPSPPHLQRRPLQRLQAPSSQHCKSPTIEVHPRSTPVYQISEVHSGPGHSGAGHPP